MSNFVKARKSGKKSVRFGPIFVEFTIYLRSKVNTCAYKFMVNVFNLPSDRILSNYDTLDRQANEGILHQMLRQMESKVEQRFARAEIMNQHNDEWLRSGILKFDERKRKEKLRFNAHTTELVGFVGGAIDTDVVLHEFTRLQKLHQDAEIDEECIDVSEARNDNLPDTAEHLLLFIFSSWDKKQQVMKRTVARYTVGAKSTGHKLKLKIEKVARFFGEPGY